MYSNCYFWARREYKRRKREWIQDGMPAGREPYWIERPSRSEPREITHYLVGGYDPWSDRVTLMSFKPVSPTDVPWWLAWTHLFFKGSAQLGDWPKTKPE